MVHLIIGILGSSSIDCDYNSGWDFYAVGYKYRCEVSNNLNISSPELVQIDAVNGTHMSGKSSNDEIYFYAYKKQIEYFPRGLENFFTNLTGIAIWGSQLKEIHQEDLKAYTKLKYLSMGTNNIEIIEDGLFDYQPDIENIIFDRCKIFHISLTVFDNLSKLTTLYLYRNKCTDTYTSNDRKSVLEIIKNVKSNCISSDYLKFVERLKNLEDDSKDLNLMNNGTFTVNLENFELDFSNSKFFKFQTLRKRIFKISNWKFSYLSDKIKIIENSKNLAVERVKNDNSASKTELNHKFDSQNNEIISMSNKIASLEHILNDMLKVQNDTVKQSKIENSDEVKFAKLEADNSALRADIQNKTDQIEKILIELNKKSTIRSPWIIIATAVIGFTQVIFFAVIFKKFIV